MEALVHISNITNRRIAKPDEVLKIGDEVTGKIIEINPEKRRIEISIRELENTEAEESKENTEE